MYRMPFKKQILKKPTTGIILLLITVAAIIIFYNIGSIIPGIQYILNPTGQIVLANIILISFVLGLLHGITPDEHTWPITFSYAVGSYSSKKGMKAGFAFSSGFTIQRAFLSTIGFLGLAYIYKQYNLDGPVYVFVGIAMAIAGMYILNKKIDLHLPFDHLLGSKLHSKTAEIKKISTSPKEVPLKMAVVHGLIAGFGFGAYATIIVFILAPQVPGLIYAPLPGLFFGLGTMVMQIIFGAVFALLARIKSLTEKQVSYVGRKTAGRTLLFGGIAFAVIGALIVGFPFIDNIAISTGNPIPNLDSLGVSTLLVLIVVGVIGMSSLVLGFREIMKLNVDKNINV